ncbi:hypothetical protein G3M48_007573 [Beauveria asiatica]|uniref:Uncharacterized protein n=1 Tax=Beauveria asiatica TaxID=1069075 RepID=A0AAW0RMH5_9HYPO
MREPLRREPVPRFPVQRLVGKAVQARHVLKVNSRIRRERTVNHALPAADGKDPELRGARAQMRNQLVEPLGGRSAAGAERPEGVVELRANVEHDERVLCRRGAKGAVREGELRGGAAGDDVARESSGGGGGGGGGGGVEEERDEGDGEVAEERDNGPARGQDEGEEAYGAPLIPPFILLRFST